MTPYLLMTIVLLGQTERLEDDDVQKLSDADKYIEVSFVSAGVSIATLLATAYETYTYLNAQEKMNAIKAPPADDSLGMLFYELSKSCIFGVFFLIPSYFCVTGFGSFFGFGALVGDTIWQRINLEKIQLNKAYLAALITAGLGGLLSAGAFGLWSLSTPNYTALINISIVIGLLAVSLSAAGVIITIIETISLAT